MGIAITEPHRELEQVARDLLSAVEARAAGRALLDAPADARPPFWGRLAEVGWLGLHLPESVGGSGYGLEELVVVVQAMGEAIAPGPFVPTVVASAVLAACGDDAQQRAWLPELADGRRTAAFGFGDSLTVSDGTATGPGGVVLGGALGELFVVLAGEDVIVVERDGAGVKVEELHSTDRSRRSVMLLLDAAPVVVLRGAARRARAVARTVIAAEAVGAARACCDEASAYARERQQFGRPIGMFQGVKHHCANMLVSAELATAASWDAARAASDELDQFELAAAVASLLCGSAVLENAHLSTQVHGGIGYTWEHDAHLFMRRAITLAGILEADDPGAQVLDAARRGVARTIGLELPPEAEAVRDEVRTFLEELDALEPAAARDRLITAGYVMPHWPSPWGRSATAVEQLVIEEELTAAGVERPDYRVAAWVILTLIQHGTPEQVERWVLPALRQDTIWCQLFSEPEAGSDAAGVRTKAERTEGGWIVNGQKVWTSDGVNGHFGLATVRTDPTLPKHKGISTFVLDLHAPGVEVRPLRQVDGNAEFSEIFLTDVFVPDADVVGDINSGWTVARATLGNERVSIGAGAGGGLGIPFDWIALFDAHPTKAPGLAPDVSRLMAVDQALDLLNLRSVVRAVIGGGPGAEAVITKLVAAEQSHRRGELGLRLVGPTAAFLDGEGGPTAMTNLRTRAMSIAGGTSEINRNQIGERLLGLPRDALLQ